MPTVPQQKMTKEEMIDVLNSMSTEIVSALHNPDDNEKNFIIIANGTPINPPCDERGNVVTGKVTLGLPHKVRRFTAEEAQIVLNRVSSKTQVVLAVHVPWRDAAKYKLAEIQTYLRRLTASPSSVH